MGFPQGPVPGGYAVRAISSLAAAGPYSHGSKAGAIA